MKDPPLGTLKLSLTGTGMEEYHFKSYQRFSYPMKICKKISLLHNNMQKKFHTLLIEFIPLQQPQGAT